VRENVTSIALPSNNLTEQGIHRICTSSLFNVPASNSDYMALNDGMTANTELEIMHKQCLWNDSRLKSGICVEELRITMQPLS
jgi:hypothetical protein